MRIEFANPEFLWFALVMPPLGWWWLRQRRNALRHPSVSVLTGLPTGRAPYTRHLGAALRCLALLLVIVALAGPRRPDLRTRLETEGVAIVMVLDVSDSMGGSDFIWDGEEITRLEAAKRAFTLFVQGGEAGHGVKFEGRPTDLIGFVAFATWPEKVCAPTMSHAVVLDLLRRQTIAKSGEADTHMSDALVVALVRLKNAPPKRKLLVLLSDGEYSPGQNHTHAGFTPEDVARIAAELDVHIYAIDADRRPENTTTTRKLSVDTMRSLARTTGGDYFSADDSAGLLKAYQAIDKLERDDIDTWHYRRYFEAYPWFAAAAFSVLILTAALESTIWRRLP
jgi:Ca-activated chloride channel family protein